MWEGRSPSCYLPAYPAGLEFHRRVLRLYIRIRMRSPSDDRADRHGMRDRHPKALHSPGVSRYGSHRSDHDRHKLRAFLFEHLPHRVVGTLRMRMRLGVGDALVEQPGAQLVVAFHQRRDGMRRNGNPKSATEVRNQRSRCRGALPQWHANRDVAKVRRRGHRLRQGCLCEAIAG